MLFALLCYGSEAASADEATVRAVIGRHKVTENCLAAEGQLGPNLRLMPTTAAVTVRSGTKLSVLDGPFSETKEVLLGLWIFDCKNLDEAIGLAQEFASHQAGGALELRPICEYDPGVLAGDR